MRYLPTGRARAAVLTGALLLLLGSAAVYAADSYDSSTNQLSMPSVAIGLATYSNMLVTVGRIVSGPTGTSPNGSMDSYDAGHNQLTVQTVNVGSATYHNVVVTVAGLVSIGAVTGADSYSNSDLSISYVQVGGAVYDNVVITVGGILGVAGGMPATVIDSYDSQANQLTIPAVMAGGTVYTNATITVGNILSAQGVFSAIQEKVPYSFGGGAGFTDPTDGTEPESSLIQGSDGNFYGTTVVGGDYNLGAVIRYSPGGTETVVHSFSNGPGGLPGSTDGAYPKGGLVQGTDGNFYGTTNEGGVNQAGTVFTITPAGNETVLHSFSGGNAVAGSTDGAEPHAGLVLASDGYFYGTTSLGGTDDVGTVFRISAAGDESVIYSFTGGVIRNSSDGVQPNAALIQGIDGNLYGTTSEGGAGGFGTVFRITLNGAESVLYSFCGGGLTSGCPDGNGPQSALIEGRDGNFYGTTQRGGAYTVPGTVFRITPGGIETVLHSFSGDGEVAGSTDGVEPLAALMLGSDGNFYGTTSGGGAKDAGTVFRMTPAGAVTVLYSFTGSLNGVTGTADGAQPVGGVIQESNGSLLGTTAQGGANNVGAVFELTNVIP